MLTTDFKHYNIKNFTSREVRNTGTELRDVNLFTMLALQGFRIHPYVNRPVILLPGGLTTGDHASYEHPAGLAVDVAFREQDGEIVIKRFVYAAVESGFKGIGTYWNGIAWSMHLDIGQEIRRWAWWKHHREEWHKTDLIMDVSKY